MTTTTKFIDSNIGRLEYCWRLLFQKPIVIGRMKTFPTWWDEHEWDEYPYAYVFYPNLDKIPDNQLWRTRMRQYEIVLDGMEWFRDGIVPVALAGREKDAKVSSVLTGGEWCFVIGLKDDCDMTTFRLTYGDLSMWARMSSVHFEKKNYKKDFRLFSR